MSRISGIPSCSSVDTSFSMSRYASRRNCINAILYVYANLASLNHLTIALIGNRLWHMISVIEFLPCVATAITVSS
jgi:hypothetical protein